MRLVRGGRRTPRAAIVSAVTLVATLLVTVIYAAGRVARGDEPYHIGRAISDITGPAVGIKMLGYVRPDQINEGIHLRQYARTFVVADAKGEHRLAIVTTDLQSITHSMVLSVLEKLRAELGDVYHLDNLILAATHT